MITVLVWLFAINIALDLIGIGMTLSGRRIEVGVGSYIFALIVNAVMLFGVITYLV